MPADDGSRWQPDLDCDDCVCDCTDDEHPQCKDHLKYFGLMCGNVWCLGMCVVANCTGFSFLSKLPPLTSHIRKLDMISSLAEGYIVQSGLLISTPLCADVLFQQCWG